ncbi:MAG TPA: hypothetical protein VK013_08970 [Myxococcaceae bacterium]|nr:hypothetical protein [Myxococcaceae bacterium]
MTTVKDLINAAPMLRPAVEALSPAVQEFDTLTTEIVEAVVEVAVAVSVAMVTGRWGDFFEKLQDVFQALTKLRALYTRAEQFQLPQDTPRFERERVEERKQRIELAMLEAAAMKKLVLSEAKRRQEELVGSPSSFEGAPNSLRR